MLTEDDAMYSFFLGATTCRGFVSLFDEFYAAKRLYVIKGGPGTGKSTLMRKCAQALSERGDDIEYIRCSSDLGSLDGFFDRTADIAFCDGTPPHTVEPRYPGAYERIVNISECWENGMLREKAGEIRSLTDEIARRHASAAAYMRAAGAILKDIKDKAERFVDEAAVNALCDNVARDWGEGGTGKGSRRLLSALSVGGYICLCETVAESCKSVLAIEDDTLALSGAILEKLAYRAQKAGAERVLCQRGILMDGVPEHLILPGIKTAIVTTSALLPDAYGGARVERIAEGSLMKGGFSRYEEEIKTSSETVSKLVEAAGACVAEAKALHDELESHYREAMDYGSLALLRERIISELI